MNYAQDGGPSPQTDIHESLSNTPSLIQNIDTAQTPTEKLNAISVLRANFAEKFGKTPEDLISSAKEAVSAKIQDALANGNELTKRRLAQLSAMPTFVGALVNNEITQVIAPLLQIDAQKLRAILAEEVRLSTQNQLAALKAEVMK